jgi:tetratricopeptide (TPR) repeat protein
MVEQLQETHLSSAALAYLRAVSKGNPAMASVRVRLEAAAALCKQSRFRKAEIIYRSVLETRPSSYRALLNLGYLARRRGDHAAALGYFEGALATKPHKRLPKLEAAWQLRRAARLDEAEALYRNILDVRPEQVRALVGLGRIAQGRGELRLAIKHYQAAVSANPARTDLKLKIAAQLCKLCRIAEARQIYEGVVMEQPNHAVARAQLRKFARPRSSGLRPFERSWLDRDTFTRADAWGCNLEALGIPAFGVSLLTLAQDFAAGAYEEVKADCILIRRDDKTKILPLVAQWSDFQHIIEREAAVLPRGSLLGYVPEQRIDGSTWDLDVIESEREFVYHRNSAAEMFGPSLSKYRQEVRRLLRSGAHLEPIGPANLDRVLACNDRWYAGKARRGRKTYYRGRTLWTFENLSVLEPLDLRHLAVVLDDDVIGYAVSSHIGKSWAVFIYRRCDREPPGIGPYLLSEMCKLYPDREWINDGPAVRKPALAWFKDRFTANASSQQMKMGWIKV